MENHGAEKHLARLELWLKMLEIKPSPDWLLDQILNPQCHQLAAQSDEAYQNFTIQREKPCKKILCPTKLWAIFVGKIQDLEICQKMKRDIY